MSGLYYTSSSGRRTPLLAPPARTTRSKVLVDPTPIGTGKGLSKSRGGAATLLKHPYRRRQKRRSTTPPSDASEDNSTEGGEQDGNEEEGEEEDEDQNDADEPAVIAPAHNHIGRETGRKTIHQTSLNINQHDHRDTLFESSDDDENEDIYRGVDEISDFADEDSEREVEQEYEDLWIAEEDPDAILDQLDEGSVLNWGAGFDSDEELIALTSDSESDIDLDVEIPRHVHFSTQHELPRLSTSSLSPLLTRALLPSALPPLELPAGLNSAEVAADTSGPSKANKGKEPAYDEDPYDSDATAEDLPPEALNADPHASLQDSETELAVPAPSSNSPKTKKNKKKKMKARRPKGPPTGTFIMDKAKPWGILDASGKKVVMVPAPDSTRHLWLDARLQKEYDATPTGSPGGLLDESDNSVTSSQELAEITMETQNVDIMLASLNSNTNTAERGEATGPSEAFYPPPGFPPGFQIAGDYVISPEGLAQLGETFSDVSNEADIPMDMEEMIVFDDDDDSSVGSPTSPAMTINMPSELSGIGFGNVSNEYPHLNNRNVTAFRRNADPAQAVLNTTPTFTSFSPSEPSTSRPQTPATSRKRKTADFPYQSPHYEGVTPVRRHVWEPRKRAKTMA